MPRSAFMKEDPKKHYWGIKRGRIDIHRDELDNWRDAEDVHYTTFNIDGVPILLLRFTPYCPECLEPTFKGLLNWEKDPSGETGIAFRCFHHFWYNGEQLWNGLPKAIMIPTTNEVPSRVLNTYDDGYEVGKAAYLEGVSHWSNPFDGRTAEGKAWSRGWQAAKEERDGITSQA